MVGGVEVACIVIIVLENVICYACNQHSWLHTQLRLPYMVWAPARSPSKPFGAPDTYWGFDVLQPAQLTTSYWLSLRGVMVLRCSTLAFRVISMTVMIIAGDLSVSQGWWWSFYTNWTWMLFGLSAVLGTALSGLHLQQDYEQGSLGSSPKAWQAVAKWNPLSLTYCLLYQTTAAAALFLSAFYWIFLHDGMSRVDFANVCKHGLVNLFPLLEVFLTRIPFMSLHFQVLFWYGSIYLVFMWSYWHAAAHWVYYLLAWSNPTAIPLYLLLAPMTAAAFFFYTSLAALREKLARSYGGTCFGFGECFEASASADEVTPQRTVQLQDLDVESDIMATQAADLLGRSSSFRRTRSLTSSPEPKA